MALASLSRREYHHPKLDPARSASTILTAGLSWQMMNVPKPQH